METGEDGSLSLDLQPGTYRLTATRVGFFDFVNEIDVKPSSDLQKFTIQLEPAPGAHTVVHAAPPKDSLRISVAPYHSVVSYKPADLASLPRTTVTIHNSHANSDETYSGVRLADLLARLERRWAKTFAAPHSPSASSPPAQTTTAPSSPSPKSILPSIPAKSSSPTLSTDTRSAPTPARSA